MRIALYMRMSTDKQENSVVSQKEFLERYAKTNKMKIVEKYIDEGISGRNAEKRPAFMQMIDDSSKDLFDAVLVYDSSRFARNLEESIVYKSALKRNDVKLISATEPTLDDDSALLTDAMLGALNEMFSRKLSKSVKRGMKYNAQQGKYQVPPPFGYMKSDGIMTIVDTEAITVNTIFNLFIERPSWHSVAVKVNDMGLRMRHGALWGSRDIKRMLQNKAYIGYVNYDGETYKGEHPSIISDETFDIVQKLISEKPHCPKSRPEHTYKHWLSSLLKCGHCGSSMSCITPKRGSAFFRCHAHACGKCKETNFVLVKDIEKIAIKTIEELIENDSFVNYEHFVPRKDKPDERIQLESALKKIHAKLDRHKAAYSDGVDSLEEYKENKEKCKLEEASIKKRLKLLSDDSVELESIKDLEVKMIGLVDTLHNSTYSIEEKSIAVKKIVQKVIYTRSTGESTVFYFL